MFELAVMHDDPVGRPEPPLRAIWSEIAGRRSTAGVDVNIATRVSLVKRQDRRSAPAWTILVEPLP